MSMWNERYSGQEYFYGTDPNDFLVTAIPNLKPGGEILCIAEGEGRNAVYLARQGFSVTAVDSSHAGLAKLTRLAQQHGVSVEAIEADLADFDFGNARWDGIVSIFCHLPPSVRASVHQKCALALRPGGLFILEAYRPEQAPRPTGGPSDPNLMMTEALLRQELQELHWLKCQSLEREVLEGKGHTGAGAVIQLIAEKARQ